MSRRERKYWRREIRCGERGKREMKCIRREVMVGGVRGENLASSLKSHTPGLYSYPNGLDSHLNSF